MLYCVLLKCLDDDDERSSASPTILGAGCGVRICVLHEDYYPHLGVIKWENRKLAVAVWHLTSSLLPHRIFSVPAAIIEKT